ncbi:MAG TPA: glycoside hydrolase family 6 protein [Capillimicrobium sp.]|nr:glycoside hydrolase family 6 protein [Capillimicrobium sp.]
MNPHRRRRAFVAALPAVALLALAGGASAATLTVQAEDLALSPGAGMVRQDVSASGGRSLLIWSTGAATRTVTTAAARRLTLRVRGDQCDGPPEIAVDVDGRRVLTASVPSGEWGTVAQDVALADGPHAVAVRFTNDANGAGCDRNLHVDELRFTSTAAVPLLGSRLWVDPASDAARQAALWRATRPGDAAVMDRLAAQPASTWFGEWSGDVAAAVDRTVSAAAAAGAVPVLVAYAIPQRDCGSHSAGGAGSPDAYRAWIRSFAGGIGARRAIVVLEPDALALADCLSAADRQTRFALLRDAVSVLASRPGVSVFIDAGHPRWLPAEEAASRLVEAGADDAQGFSLDVSNFVATDELLPYARRVGELAGGKHFVFDTSRNGLGPDPGGEWCNPPGRALGATPTTRQLDRRHDASLWIKRPGESDGACNGGPPAGSWWPEYALGLARAAGW